MADNDKAKSDCSANEADKAADPAGQSKPSATVRDPEAVLAQNAELLKELKELKKWKAKADQADADRETAKKKDEGKFNEIIAEKEAALAARDAILKRKEISLLMQKHNLQDPDYVDILLSRVEFDESFTAQNADEIFAALKKEKPFLFGEPATKSAPPKTDTAKPVSIKPGHVFTRAEINRLMLTEQGRAVLRENKSELDRQWAAGLVK